MSNPWPDRAPDPDPDEGLSQIEKNWKSAGMPTTCVGWVLFVVIAVIAHASAAWVRGLFYPP